MKKSSYVLNDITNKKVLITGASAGIGRATAILLASEGAQVKLVARREEKLNDIKELYPNNVEILSADISNKEDIKKLENAGFFYVDICINNAGLALGTEYIDVADEADWEKMLQVNVSSNFLIVKKVLPYMKKYGGDIIGVSSISATAPYEGGAVYCATKSAVNTFYQSLRYETFDQNIRVMLLSPGAVETEFSQVRFKGDRTRASQVYSGFEPLTPEDMAHHLLYMITRPIHVNIDNLISLPTHQAGPKHLKRD
jgi:3-hydroxy acid dehydrogenase/malonic semialdehyde reductase